MMYKRDFERILEDVEFGDWKFLVRYDAVGMDRSEYPTTRCYLQIQAITDCSEGGGRQVWKGRKWFLSPHMCKSEVVNTAFMAVMAATEHETRETFRYKGANIYNPHYDVERLVELRRSAGALGTREEQL